jgi:hypothetical protein
LQNVSFAIPTELVGCVRSEAGRVFGASGMRRCSNDALRVHLAAPHADCVVAGADVNPGFAIGSIAHNGICGSRKKQKAGPMQHSGPLFFSRPSGRSLDEDRAGDAGACALPGGHGLRCGAPPQLGHPRLRTGKVIVPAAKTKANDRLRGRVACPLPWFSMLWIGCAAARAVVS